MPDLPHNLHPRASARSPMTPWEEAAAAAAAAEAARAAVEEAKVAAAEAAADGSPRRKRKTAQNVKRAIKKARTAGRVAVGKCRVSYGFAWRTCFKLSAFSKDLIVSVPSCTCTGRPRMMSRR